MSRLIPIPASIPRRGNWFLRRFGHAILALLGWRVEGEFPDIPKLVVAVAPHTSNWDFAIGVAVMFALDLRLAYLGKDSLFRGPFGAFFRWTGGIAVDRASAHGVVEESIRAFRGVGDRMLVIAPEGTRKRVEHFKPGFLHIARGAGVPVLLAAFDYPARRMVMGPLVHPGPDVDADRQRVEAHFSGFRGKHPRASA